MKILIIEDEEENKSIMSGMLSDYFDIEMFDLAEHTIDDIVSYVKENQFYFVISDFNLTNSLVGFTGGELIDALVSNCSYMQAVLLTAYTTDAIKGSNNAIYVTERPRGSNEEWGRLILLIGKMVSSFESKVASYEELLNRFSRQEKLSRDEQILYAEASSFLYEIGARDKDLINENLKLKTVASSIHTITESLVNIEKKLAES